MANENGTGTQIKKEGQGMQQGSANHSYDNYEAKDYERSEYSSKGIGDAELSGGIEPDDRPDAIPNMEGEEENDAVERKGKQWSNES